jgi:hypothetical protein
LEIRHKTIGEVKWQCIEEKRKTKRIKAKKAAQEAKKEDSINNSSTAVGQGVHSTH